MLPCGPSSFWALDSCTQPLPRRLKDVAKALQAQCWKWTLPPLLPLHCSYSRLLSSIFHNHSSCCSRQKPQSHYWLLPLPHLQIQSISIPYLLSISPFTPSQHHHAPDYWISILEVPSLILWSSLLNSLSRVSNFSKIANIFMSLTSSCFSQSWPASPLFLPSHLTSGLNTSLLSISRWQNCQLSHICKNTWYFNELSHLYLSSDKDTCLSPTLFPFCLFWSDQPISSKFVCSSHLLLGPTSCWARQ